MLEKTLESPLDCKEIKPANTTGNQSWIFIGRTDAEAEAPILWPPDVKNWFIGKDANAGKYWRQEEKGDYRGWDGWLTSLNGWTWVWASSRSWWRIGKPGMLQSMGSQRFGHNWATELNWTKLNILTGMHTFSSHRILVPWFAHQWSRLIKQRDILLQW